jgi:hypothetical protein
MNELEKQLRKIRQIALSRKEREKVRTILSEYAKTNPVRDAGFDRQNIQEDAYTHTQYDENRFTRFIHSRFMTPLIIGLVLLVGTGTTVAAADAARPGDLLFPVDRIVENVRLSVGSDDRKNELRLRFAEERVDELSEIIDEETADDDLAMAEVESTQSVRLASTETDAAADEDTERRKQRIEHGIETAISFLEDALVRAEENGNTQAVESLEQVIVRLNERLEVLDERFEVRVREAVRAQSADEDDSENRVEVRIRNQAEIDERIDAVRDRIRVRIEDGELRLEDRSDNDSTEGLTEVEVDVFTNETIVKVEINDETHTFVTETTDRALLVAEIAARFGVTEAEVEAVLEFEVEDRESRADNTNDSSGRDGRDGEDGRDGRDGVEVEADGRVRIDL